MGKLLQIGSGKNVGENWVNIDQITFPGVQTVNIDPNLNLPIGDHEVSVAYTSHFLEHLDDSTVARVLAESFRVLQDNGSLVIKIPDFSMIQAWYRENNWEQFQKFKFFGVTSVLERWKKYNVQPTYTNVASMMFCGYWSKSLNDHFKFGVQADTDGYHGPARIDENITREILLNFGPHDISKKFTEFCKQDPDFGAFNHQNAWSQTEFVSLAKSWGFRLVCDKPSDICKKFSNAPKIIDNMSPWSMYLEFIKPI